MAVQHTSFGGSNAGSGKSDTQGTVVDPFTEKLPPGTSKRLVLENPDDAWARAIPPIKGYYDLKLYPGKDAYKKRYEDDNNPKADEVFYSANIECRIVEADNPEDNNYPVFANFSTRINRGKDISTMAAIMVKMGKNPIPKGQTEATDADVLQNFAKWIKTEPIVRGNLIDWRFSYKDETTGKYRNVARTYEDFPESSDGGREATFPYTKSDGTRDIAQAQLFVAEWGGKTAKPKEEGATTASGKTNGKIKASVVVDDIEEAPKATRGGGKPAVAVVADDLVEDL